MAANSLDMIQNINQQRKQTDDKDKIQSKINVKYLYVNKQKNQFYKTTFYIQ